MPLKNRDEFKKEVAAKLLTNCNHLEEDQTAHLIFLGGQLTSLIIGAQRQFFQELSEEINSYPSEQAFHLDYYPQAMNLLEQYLVTDRPYEIHTLNNGDLVANWAARKAMGQIRNAAASTSINRTAFTGEDLELPKAMRIETGKIRCNSFRFLPVHQQAWLLGKEELDILRVKCHEVKM